MSSEAISLLKLITIITGVGVGIAAYIVFSVLRPVMKEKESKNRTETARKDYNQKETAELVSNLEKLLKEDDQLGALHVKGRQLIINAIYRLKAADNRIAKLKEVYEMTNEELCRSVQANRRLLSIINSLENE